jgi:TonB family protein
VVEHYLDTVGVRGSKPLPRTIACSILNSKSRHFRYLRLVWFFGASFLPIITSTHAKNETEPPDFTKYAGATPYPEYPFEARRQWLTASGMVVLQVDQRTGSVMSAVIAQSSGHRILDDAALKAFRAWRFKSGTVSKVRLPVSFTMANALGAINAPRPKYPYDARSRYFTGSGVVLLEVDPHTGYVTSAPNAEERRT